MPQNVTDDVFRSALAVSQQTEGTFSHDQEQMFLDKAQIMRNLIKGTEPKKRLDTNARVVIEKAQSSGGCFTIMSKIVSQDDSPKSHRLAALKEKMDALSSEEKGEFANTFLDLLSGEQKRAIAQQLTSYFPAQPAIDNITHTQAFIELQEAAEEFKKALEELPTAPLPSNVSESEREAYIRKQLCFADTAVRDLLVDIAESLGIKCEYTRGILKNDGIKMPSLHRITALEQTKKLEKAIEDFREKFEGFIKCNGSVQVAFLANDLFKDVKIQLRRSLGVDAASIENENIQVVFHVSAGRAVELVLKDGKEKSKSFGFSTPKLVLPKASVQLG